MKDFIVITETLVDMRSRFEMKYFLSVLPGKKNCAKQIHLCVLDINTLNLTTSPINFRKEDMSDIQCSHIWVTRDSELETVVEGQLTGHGTERHYPMIFQKLRFTVSHYLPDQGQRLVIKHFMITH